MANFSCKRAIVGVAAFIFVLAVFEWHCNDAKHRTPRSKGELRLRRLELLEAATCPAVSTFALSASVRTDGLLQRVQDRTRMPSLSLGLEDAKALGGERVHKHMSNGQAAPTEHSCLCPEGTVNANVVTTVEKGYEVTCGELQTFALLDVNRTQLCAAGALEWGDICCQAGGSTDNGSGGDGESNEENQAPTTTTTTKNACATGYFFTDDAIRTLKGMAGMGDDDMADSNGGGERESLQGHSAYKKLGFPTSDSCVTEDQKAQLEGEVGAELFGGQFPGMDTLASPEFGLLKKA